MLRQTFARYVVAALMAYGAFTAAARAADVKIELAILVDVSASNPLVSSQEQASRIANDIAPFFDLLTEGSRVTMATFGAYDLTRNPMRQFVVSTRARPSAIKQGVLSEIQNLPVYAQTGKLQPQERTNIVAALEDIAGRADCQAFRTLVIVATDGIENSEYGQLPPKNAKPIFKGCAEIHFIGINGVSAKHTQQLIAEWQRWSNEAGFLKVRAIR
jgi:hypothetical protein